jgi:glycerol-3-phosphate cytidylyltransferase
MMNKGKIGFNCSSFDMFHCGHVTMLKKEKELCDYLKVALQVDPTIDRPGIKNKPIQSVYERYVQVQACKYVDEILVYETEQDLMNLLMTQDIHIRFLGEEYREKDFTGKQFCIDHGIELYYHSRKHPFSSTELRNRVYELERIKRETPQPETLPQHSTKLLDSYLSAESRYIKHSEN